MSVTGVLRLFRVKPQNPIGPEGQMALADHLRELRARTMVVALVLTLGVIVAWFFYDTLFNLLLSPYEDARETLEARGVETTPVISGVATPLLLRLKVSALAAVIATSPIWLYEIWAFIVPGLRPHDLRQETLGCRITVEHAAFAALLVIDDELHGDVRLPRPERVRRPATIAYKFARIGLFGHVFTFAPLAER